MSKSKRKYNVVGTFHSKPCDVKKPQRYKNIIMQRSGNVVITTLWNNVPVTLLYRYNVFRILETVSNTLYI